VPDIIRTGAALTGLGVAGGVGVTIGLLASDRRQGANVAAAIGPHLALVVAGVKLNVTGEEHLCTGRRCSSSTTRARSALPSSARWSGEI
jgi:putative phosphoserine phosphatase / 1-acylglycerol-3-phosphate O-acyltransferase